MLLRSLRCERSFALLLRVFRASTAFILELGPLLPTECEIFLAMLANMVETGATIVDCIDPDTTFVTKSRFGSVGAKIVADAHRWFSDKSMKGSSKAVVEAVADDDTPQARVTLPKLILVLETWHMLTSQHTCLRFIFQQYDAVPDRAKVRAF
jgi:hypothetical protein